MCVTEFKVFAKMKNSTEDKHKNNAIENNDALINTPANCI
jgi:hypothetical protein